ncbi:hypothetical protein N0V90_002160 [Kalmusia sp. IMI 367209]|nr:hypothetical protein N0V90_002160 [Kalmusia sp. IMI 367209]
MVFSLSKAAALLMVGSMGVEAAKSVSDRIPTEHNRVLRAATKKSAHEKRSFRIEKRFELELPYVEEATQYNGHSIFASQLKVASKKPILNLEDIEHHLDDVECGDGTMTLKFFDTSSAVDARLACHGPEGGVIVTSHDGCNNEGERTVYTVNDISASGDGSVLELAVEKTLFEHAFDTIEVGFGHTEEIHVVRDHADFKLRRRQLAELDRAAAGAKEADRLAKGAKNSSDVLSNISDEGDVGSHEVKFNLNWEMTNKTFRPDEILYGLPVGVSFTNIANLPIELTCKKCLTMGDIKLTQGNIQIDTAALKGIPDKIKAIPGMVASAVPSLINAIPDKMNEAGEKLESAAAPAVSAVTSIIDAVPSKVESIAAGVTSAVAAVPSKVESKVDSIINQIPSIIPDIPKVDIPNPFGRRDEKAKRGEQSKNVRKARREEKAKRADFDLGKIITGGFVELQADNLEAYFEIGAKPKSTGQFTFYLLDLPILGFSIPGVGHAGAIFEVLLEADYEFEGGFDLTYGMNLRVPSNSTMRIDLGDMSQSGIKGFQDSVLTPLPFNFKQKQLDGFVSIAMVPSIPIGFKFMSVLDVGVEVEMDLPRLDAMVSTIDDADTQCNDLSLDEEEEGEEGEEGEEEETGDETEETGDETEETGDETEETGDETEETGDETEETGDETEETGDETEETGDETEETGDETEETGDETEETGDEETSTGDEETSTGDETEETGDEETSTGDEETSTGDEETSTGDDEELTDETDETDADAELERKKRSIKKRSIKKRDVKAIRRASKARRAPASLQAKRARDLHRRQTEAPFTNGTGTQPAKLSLVYVEWNVSMAAEVAFNFVLPGMPQVIPGVDTNNLSPFKPIHKTKHLFTTVKAMPTLCLAPKKGFRPATDVYTDPSEVGTVGTIGTGVIDATGAPAAGKPKFTDVPESNSTDFKLRRRDYGYGVDIPPYTEATPTPTPEPTPTPTPTPSESTSTPCESTSTPSPPPPPSEECGGYGQPACETSTPPPAESTSEVPPPPESTPVESTSEIPPSPETTPRNPLAESTPAESTPAESTPAESTPAESTPCTTETPPPAPPTSSPCTTSTTITVTLPYNTTTPAYQQPLGTASPPVPSKPSEFTGSAAVVMPTVGAVLFGLFAMFML